MPQPNPNGIAMPAAPTLKAIRQFNTRSRRSTSSPTRKRNRIRPTLAAIEKAGIEAAGNMAFVKPGMRPNTEGPSSMPPMTSAITLGCLILERGKWRRRQKMMIMPAYNTQKSANDAEGRNEKLNGEQHTCIMKVMIGLLGLYIEGFMPSRMPPWAGTLTTMAVTDMMGTAK